MEKEILEEYEKIKDKVSTDEFLNEVEEIKRNNSDLGFINDLEAAQMVVQNHNGVEETLFSQNDFNDSQEESFEPITTLDNDLLERYEKIKDHMSQEEFLNKLNEEKKGYDNSYLMPDVSIADMIVGQYITEKNETLTQKEEYNTDTINKLEDGNKNKTVKGIITRISNPISFTTRKSNKPGKLCNIELKDNTGSIRVTLWTENIKLLKNCNEGDIVQIDKLNIKDGYSGLEASMTSRSNIIHVKEPNPDDYPKYVEEITKISDIEDDTTVNIIAKIVKISTIRTFEKDGKTGEVRSIQLKDESGEITYTLWNKSTSIIEDLGLNDGDNVKILGANARLGRDDEMTLTHRDGRIVKGDFEVNADVSQNIVEITSLSEDENESNIGILGIVSRIQDIKVFKRKTDDSEGKLRNFTLMDNSGSIRVTLWNDDTSLPLNKGDIVKLVDFNVKYDDYLSNISINTNFNTQITINPENISTELLDQLDLLKEGLGPIDLEEVKQADDDGQEVDVAGWILSTQEIKEFEREDGSVGKVKSVGLSDGTEFIRVSFWDNKADGDYKVGEAYQIENARTRWGYNDDIELNVGSMARIIRLDDFMPSFETVESMVYTHRSIDEIEDEYEENIVVIGRVIEISDIHEFERMDGTTSYVRNIEIGDNTGAMRVVLWGDDTKREFEEGQAIKLQNPRITYNNDHLELSVSVQTAIITDLSESELNGLPSFDELKEAIYIPKSIESIEDNDRNIIITGTLKDVVGNKLVITKCPNCNSTIEVSNLEDETICDYCGDVIDEVNYLLMIPATIEDDTGEISVTFFGKLVEELLEKSQEELIEVYKENAEDPATFEGLVEDLEGKTIELIGNVNYSEFNEEIRLNPNKILSIY